tara:strand:- start:414 stop:923 length:510 start_codon:yes stop_codon:yes gene_type:complete
MQTTEYKGITRIYFYRILFTLIKLGNLSNTNKTILDFGCGYGMLKKLLPNSSVIGYDIVEKWSDVKSWEEVPFDIFVSNQTFCHLEENEVNKILKKIKNINPEAIILVGMSRKSFINKLGMQIFNYKNAHSAYRLDPSKELLILKKYCKITRRKSVLFLSDVYLCEFKK